MFTGVTESTERWVTGGVAPNDVAGRTRVERWRLRVAVNAVR
jgi:hypothetical protein